MVALPCAPEFTLSTEAGPSRLECAENALAGLRRKRCPGRWPDYAGNEAAGIWRNVTSLLGDDRWLRFATDNLLPDVLARTPRTFDMG